MATALPNNLEEQGEPQQETPQLTQITSIIEEEFPSYEKTAFCYEIVKRTLNALLTHRYSEFDAHTTSNCCHGISLLVRELILKSQQEDLTEWQEIITKKIDREEIDLSLKIPQPIVELSQLYILGYIRSMCPIKGIPSRSTPSKLKDISPLGKRFFQALTKNLQRKISNQVALSYQNYLREPKHLTETCGIPTRLWAKYVSPPYLRTSTNDIYFASCLFSMQVVLAYLILSRAKIAIINDIYKSKDEFTNTYVRVLEGNGTDGFDSVKLDPHLFWVDEPIVVFSGCSYNETPDLVYAEMNEWADRIPNLILASDVFYPQFPKSCDDINFNCHPIIPEEPILQRVIDSHRKIAGVSSCNPNLYCLNHIYSSSLKQVISNDLASYKIPRITSKI